MYNKRKFNKINNKKILHKVRKHWVTVSIAMLGLIGGGALTTVNASANTGNTNTNPQNSNNNENEKQISTNSQNQKKLVNNQANSNNQNSQNNSNSNNEPTTSNITQRANQLHSNILVHTMMNNIHNMQTMRMGSTTIHKEINTTHSGNLVTVNNKQAKTTNNVNHLRINNAKLYHKYVYDRIHVPFHTLRVKRNLLLHSSIDFDNSKVYGIVHRGARINIKRAFKEFGHYGNYLRYEVALTNNRMAFITGNNYFVKPIKYYEHTPKDASIIVDYNHSNPISSASSSNYQAPSSVSSILSVLSSTNNTLGSITSAMPNNYVSSTSYIVPTSTINTPSASTTQSSMSSSSMSTSTSSNSISSTSYSSAQSSITSASISASSINSRANSQSTSNNSINIPISSINMQNLKNDIIKDVSNIVASKLNKRVNNIHPKATMLLGAIRGTNNLTDTSNNASNISSLLQENTKYETLAKDVADQSSPSWSDASLSVQAGDYWTGDSDYDKGKHDHRRELVRNLEQKLQLVRVPGGKSSNIQYTSNGGQISSSDCENLTNSDYFPYYVTLPSGNVIPDIDYLGMHTTVKYASISLKNVPNTFRDTTNSLPNSDQEAQDIANDLVNKLNIKDISLDAAKHANDIGIGFKYSSNSNTLGTVLVTGPSIQQDTPTANNSSSTNVMKEANKVIDESAESDDNVFSNIALFLAAGLTNTIYGHIGLNSQDTAHLNMEGFSFKVLKSDISKELKENNLSPNLTEKELVKLAGAKSYGIKENKIIDSITGIGQLNLINLPHNAKFNFAMPKGTIESLYSTATTVISLAKSALSGGIKMLAKFSTRVATLNAVINSIVKLVTTTVSHVPSDSLKDALDSGNHLEYKVGEDIIKLKKDPHLKTSNADILDHISDFITDLGELGTSFLQHPYYYFNRHSSLY